MSSHGGTRRLTTVLFTDIVASTDVATELGDARWRALLSRHHRIVRRELKRFGGREVDTAGDGFFATFPAPADGVRCACAVSDGVRELGIEIRAGLHFGETEQMRPKVAGIAVVMASRIAGLAGAGEVLVSSTVEELVAGSGVEFEDRGSHALKGVAGEKHLFAARAVDGHLRAPPLDAVTSQERLGKIEPSALGRRRSWVVVGAAAAVGVAVLVGLLLVSKHAMTYVPGIDTVARIDSHSHAFDRPVHVGKLPTGIAFAGGSVWVTNQGDSTIDRIDPTSGLITATKSTQGVPTGVAGGGAGLFITTGLGGIGGVSDLLTVNPHTSEIRVGCPTPPGVMALALGGNVVWMADSDGGNVIRVDPINCSELRIALKPGADPEVITSGGNPADVWVGDQLQPTVFRIDPGASSPAVTGFGVGGEVTGIAVADGSVWATLAAVDELVRMNPSGQTTQRISLGPSCDGPQGIAVGGDGGVWIGCYLSGMVAEIDPRTNQIIRTLPVNGSPDAVVTDMTTGDVWVSVHAA